MGAVKMSVTIPEWMYKEMALGRNSNKSERIQELIMKGYMSEKGIMFEVKDKKSLNVGWEYRAPDHVIEFDLDSGVFVS